MKTNESTYALLVRSEEKERGWLETILYAFFILSAVTAICQFAFQPVHVPAAGNDETTCVACQPVTAPADVQS